MTVPTNNVVCNWASPPREKSAQVLELQSFGKAANVRLKLGQFGASMLAHPPAAFLDLIEIATFVYVADQQVHRGANDVDTFGGNWRRNFKFHVPVRAPQLWSSDSVRLALRSLLTFLSDDDYEFEFSLLRSPPELPNYLDFTPDPERPQPSEVILFSGGLDSLGGVVERVIEQQQAAILVTHESTAKHRKRHHMLREMIENRTRGPLPQHLTVTVNMQGQEGREYTQRSRSFLYASLAAATARMIARDKVTFFENGIVSMNLPLAAQVVGSKSTRTTHPVVLGRMAKLFSLLDNTPFSVSNGFLWKTKTDVVELIKGAGHADLIPWSTSCMHTWLSRKDQPHCGNCSQCVDRRFAVLAGAGDDCESAASYQRDLLTGERDDDESRMLVAAYTERAESLSRMSEMNFSSSYGVMSRLLRHVGCDEDKALQQIHALHQRHGKQVVGVLEGAIARHRREIIANTLPKTCLLRLAIDQGLSSPTGQSPVPPTPANHLPPRYGFLSSGVLWEVHFEGMKFHINDSMGAKYLKLILSYPRTILDVAKLNIAVRPGWKGAIDTRPELVVRASDLDTNLHAFNCLNGTIDLRTGGLRAARPDDLITKISEVWFDPAAKCPKFMAFLDRIFGGDTETIAFVQRFLGMSLSGDISEQYLPIFLGPGANGKSVLCDLILSIMGGYATVAPASLLTDTGRREHPTELADLLGRRLVIASESEEGAELKLQQIKRLTGDMTLKGRFMRQDFFEFNRTHKLVQVTNNKPRVRENSEAVWRRLRVVPFTVIIPETERDPLLLGKLMEESSGVLNWLVHGCLAWRREGLGHACRVDAATRTYRHDQDDVSRFIAECFEREALGEGVQPSWFAPWSVLKPAYTAWCGESGVNAVTDRALQEALDRLGFATGTKRVDSKPTKGRLGLRLAEYAGAEEEVLPRYRSLPQFAVERLSESSL